MDKVTHFELPADDMNRAKEFYNKTFGWEIQDMPDFGYTLLHTTEMDMKKRMPKEPGAINGGVYKREASMPHPQVFMDVKDIDASLKKIEENGGETVRGKTPVGEMGFVANFKDPEGNILGLWQSV